MKYLLLLLLPFLTSAQCVEPLKVVLNSQSETLPTITFHEGAGLNPRHIESLGPDSGWVELWVGPMAMDGQALRIHFNDWDEIESLEVTSFFVEYTKVTLKPTSRKTENWIGLEANGAEQGDFIRYTYTVKRKKA